MVYFGLRLKLCESTNNNSLPTISCQIHEITPNTSNTRNIKDKKHNKTKYALNYSSQVYRISIIFHHNPEIFLPLQCFFETQQRSAPIQFITEPITEKHISHLT